MTGTTNGTLIRTLTDKRGEGSSHDALLYGTTLIHVPVNNVFFYITLQHNGINPYPSSTNNAPSEIMITRLG